MHAAIVSLNKFWVLSQNTHFLAKALFFSLFSQFGAAPPFGRVGPLRSSQLCSALRGLCPLGLPPLAALLQPLSRGAARLCGGSAACPPQWTN
ncbi:hypothetical protein SGRA_1940 [Saprospira grandis str. Lewin]|uniref:Uncharacterized protein n=1 Tax=Saprospira grandis (strain Lewin) TaxID=984262 RepID=H6L1M7_SAPGL|nr:hypothetical protein SGRA_1940 [Saprospira grandis str. Lewin]